MKLNLTAQGKEQELVLAYLEENASEVLAEKINNGVRIQKGADTVINRKTLDGFFDYANQEARKLAAKGANCACIEESVVYGWAIHYFEEESIEEKLYREDGSAYSPAPKKKENSVAPVTSAPVKPKAPTVKQMSLFEFGEEIFDEPSKEDEDPIELTETTVPDDYDEETEAVEETKISPLYKEYMDFKGRHPDFIVAMRVGDFYEIFGDDAKLVAEHAELTLVSRDFGLEERVPMVGFPFHREEQFRKKIQEFSPIAIYENEKDVEFHFKKDEGASYQVNTETGELIEEAPINNNALVQLLFDLLKGDLEVKQYENGKDKARS